MTSHLRSPLAAVVAAAVITGPASAQVLPDSSMIAPEQRIYSPYVERTARNGAFAEGLYWGDTHLHTSWSMDAGMVGNRIGPEDAFRFARGEEILTSTGQRSRLIRPLDFLVVADHAENVGIPPLLAEANPDLLATEYGRRFYDLFAAGDGYEAYTLWGNDGIAQNRDVINDPRINRTVWERATAMADAFDDPGTFTAFIGYEWTSINNMTTPGNLHRILIFRDDAAKANQIIPFSAFDSADPEDLWEWMGEYEANTGGRILAIPHNGNISNGLMFSVERLNGEPVDSLYAEVRRRWEPLYEVTQIKGDGEAHPFLSPNDEFADYGTWDKADIAGLVPKEDWMLPYEYARSALQVGLQLEQQIGVNPFKFGMIGSTDAHTSMSTTRDENFWGKFSGGEPAADRYEHYVIRALSGDDNLSTYEWETLASGLAGVWARENSREAIFEAMQRKETYATTGTRITVRLFGGWDYEEDDVFRPNAVEIGYDKGVPMGGDLPTRPAGARAPMFMAGALKDAWSGNLDRVQIVKGWVDAEGERQERIWDIACSDDRPIRNDRCDGAVGNTVDEENATYTNNIGDAELRALWTDPDFDPALPAVYYVRVLEIPTPTWQAHDSNFFDITMPDEVPMSHQERAYTSPIGYTPGG